MPMIEEEDGRLFHRDFASASSVPLGGESTWEAQGKVSASLYLSSWVCASGKGAG